MFIQRPRMRFISLPLMLHTRQLSSRITEPHPRILEQCRCGRGCHPLGSYQLKIKTLPHYLNLYMKTMAEQLLQAADSSSIQQMSLEKRQDRRRDVSPPVSLQVTRTHVGWTHHVSGVSRHFGAVPGHLGCSGGPTDLFLLGHVGLGFVAPIH